MWVQPRGKAYRESTFFADRQGNRPVVEGTVAHGTLDLDAPYTTGFSGTKPIAKIPARAVEALGGPRATLERGEEQFHIYCQPCHGRLGDGNGFIAQRGLGYWQKLPATLHTDRLRKAPDGHFYDVIVNGKGVMYSYASRIQSVDDRWAVVAYVRTLQRAYTENAAALKPRAIDETTKTERTVVPGNPAQPAPTGEAR
jgi:mono/diheme cytochrome c family protein